MARNSTTTTAQRTARTADADGEPASIGGRILAYLRSTNGAAFIEWLLRHTDVSGFLLVAAASGLVYFMTAEGRAQPLDYYSRLAEAFLNGRYWLTDAPSWLNELIPAGDGRWYIAYPPMPAVLAMPFVALFGREFPAQWYSEFYAAIAMGVVYLVLGRLNANLRVRARLGLTAVFAFGTVWWYIAVSGSAWYFAHVSAVLFFGIALLCALDRRPAWLAGLFLGLAALSRLPVGLGLPLVAAAQIGMPGLRAIRTIDWRMVGRNALLFTLGLGVPAIIYVLFNEARYGTITDQSYTSIPGVLEDPIYAKHGILSVWYIPRNLFAILFRSWNYVDDAPWLQPSWWGLGIFLTTPLYAWLLRGRIRDARVGWALLAVVLISLPIITHGNVGISQFGYRFSLDFQLPLFVILATVLGRRWDGLAKVAGILSIVICAYALWAIRIDFVAY